MLQAKETNTKAIVIINPNNPTGAVYSQDLLEQLIALAREHNLVMFADEIYPAWCKKSVFRLLLIPGFEFLE